MTGRVERLVIVGRDLDLWLGAAVLAEALVPIGIDVIAVELPSRVDAASAITAHPPLEALHARIGIDEAQLLRETGGSFSLGWNIAGMAPRPFFLAHGSYGVAIDDEGFLPHWVMARANGMAAAFEDFSPTAMAARHGRVLLPDDETATFGRTDYGYHLPAIPYLTLLKTRASRLGAACRQAERVTVDRDGAGRRSLRLGDGTRIEGDLFIDASGADAVLGSAEGESWRDMVAADTVIRARAPRFAALPAYAEIRAGDRGWMTLSATASGTFVSYAFAQDDDGDPLPDAAALAGLPLEEPVLDRLVPGRRGDPWRHDIVAIGEAAARLDPVFGVGSLALQLDLVHLLSLFPAGVPSEAERAEYNRIIGSVHDRLRDFQAAFYACARRAGPFWDRARGVRRSPELAHRIETFRARGDIAPIEDDSFAPDQWQALLIGLGEMPESWPPAIDRLPPDRLRGEFRRILGFVKEKVLAQATHDDLLARTTGAR